MWQSIIIETHSHARFQLRRSLNVDRSETCNEPNKLSVQFLVLFNILPYTLTTGIVQESCAGDDLDLTKIWRILYGSTIYTKGGTPI